MPEPGVETQPVPTDVQLVIPVESAVAQKTAASSSRIHVSGLCKSYGQTVALVDADFDLRRGEVHALVGENGSGKSTIVKVLSGIQLPDGGTATVDGAPYPVGSPRASIAAGVATVFQEVLSVGPMSVVDNLWLGADGVFSKKVDRASRRRRAQEILAELLEVAPDLDAPIEELGLSDRQACSIARALLRDPKVLILDEATSALDHGTRERLFRRVRLLTAGGAGVIIISHRMDEIEDIADRVTVLRSGRTVAVHERNGWTPGQLVSEMTGVDREVRQKIQTRDHSLGPVVLGAYQMALGPHSSPFELEFRAGEIVGLAGLEGHGQDLFLRALWGDRVHAGSIVKTDGERRDSIRNRRDASQHHIAYVPRERRDESTFGSMSILENFALVTISRDTRAGLISRKASRSRFAKFIRDMRIKMGRDSDRLSTLSGGNQQKVVVARWLSADPDVLLLNDPTRGIDINAKRDLYEMLGTVTSAGMCVVMLSSDVDEQLELMDRVVVFRDETVERTFSREDVTRESLVAAFFGEDMRA